MIQLFSFTGDQNTSTVESASGRDAPFKNGIRRPFFEVHRSDQDAIIGSVNASKILPKAVIPGVILAVLAALGAGLWMVWIRKRRKEEAEAAARRRERRRQRLMEEGPEAAAEFNRLLEEKKNRSQGRGHRR